MKTSSAGLREIDVIGLEGDCFDRDDKDVRGARRRLLAKLSSASAATLVRLDLTGARVSSSCLGEILGTALEGIHRGRYEGRYVVVVDPDGRHEFELDAALEKESKNRQEKLVCVWRGPGDESRLTGQVDQQVGRTYNFVCEHWTHPDGATARRFVETDSISIQAASNRLAKASKMGLIHPADRMPVGGGGTQWLYVPVR